MFRGISAINLDTKGRFAIPVRHRDACEGKLIVTIDTESPCLLLYPLPEWELIEQKLRALPSFNKAARRIQRLLIGHATDVDIDESGRVLLPKILRDYAGLQKKAVLVGQGTKLELWGEQQWQEGREQWLAEETGSEGELPPELQSISL